MNIDGLTVAQVIDLLHETRRVYGDADILAVPTGTELPPEMVAALAEHGCVIEHYVDPPPCGVHFMNSATLS